MKTGRQTTYILLDKNSEDVALLKEINSLIAQDLLGKGKDIYKDYPILMEIKRNLELEEEACYDCMGL